MKKKNRILNIIMVLLAFVMVGGAVMYAGSLKGWFDKNDKIHTAVAEPGTGSSSVTRNGVGFSIGSSTALRDGDILATSSMSTLLLKTSAFDMTMGPETSLDITKASDETFESALTKGEAFLDLKDSDSLAFKAGELDIDLEEGIYHISVQAGSVSVGVFKGNAKLSSHSAKAGEVLSIVSDEIETVPLAAASLNEFTIENAKKAIASSADAENICFTTADLDKVIADREEEKRLALEALAKHEAEILAQGGTEAVTVPVQVGGGGQSSGSSSKSCTIQILCNTILDNMGDLTPGKSGYVPSNGVILSTTRVGFNDGDTVFDVLKSICNYAGIQIEYSWTPMYNSYYIEGINYLYEFDCGPQSGWMYKVNGWFPNYGCSSYKLSDGDVIVWCYTCKGLGADVGGAVY